MKEPVEDLAGQKWSIVFRRSAPGRKYMFSVRSPYEHRIEAILRTLGTPQDARSRREDWQEWQTGYGKAITMTEYTHGYKSRRFVWVQDIELLNYLCEQLQLVPPRFLTKERNLKIMRALTGEKTNLR